jgi:hypothetical protein
MTPKPEYLEHHLFTFAAAVPHRCAEQRSKRSTDMRLHAVVVVALLASAIGLSAKNVLPTIPQPVHIANQGFLVHVLTRGVDVDFDGVQDPGDTVASWHRFAPNGLAIGSYEFPWGAVAAARPALDTLNERMFVIVSDTLYVLNTAFMVPMPLSGWTQGGVAVSMRNDSTLMISTRPSYTEPGIVRFVRALDGTPLDGQIEAGVNVQATYALHDDTVLVLSEGSFGATDGSLALAVRTGATWTSTTLATGGTANHLHVVGRTAYVTMNSTHEVVVVDLDTRTVARRISTGTSGLDGPRESVVHDGRLFVTTFAGDVRIYDLTTGSIVGRISVDAKPEALAIVDGSLWVCRTFDRASYAVQSGVNVYTLNDATGIVETMRRTRSVRAIIAPSGLVRVPELDATNGLVIVGMDGRTQPADVIDAHEPTVDLRALPHGTYVVRSGTDAVVVVR